ncbi:MAG: phage tail tape measure protein [Sedimentisphaerales bacterium]|nr:phage tail tape measure protein [Sedimentisphaerales bacterium]
MSGSSGAIRAGRAFVELFADDSQLVRGLRRAEAKLKAFGNSVRDIGMGMAKLGAAAVAPLAASTKVFTGFDDQMRSVQAVLGATGAQFDLLNEKAKFLGRTTSYTAAQVAGAMLELARAGFNTDEIDKATADMLALARATGTDLAEATNIAGNTLRSFGLSAEDMGRVADVMTATANNSAQTLTDLGEAMKYSAPVADAYGLSIEQTSKALGALANFGIKGSMAGNTMKNIMLQLANPSIRKQIEGLGVSVTDAAGNFRDVGSILTGLGSAMNNLPRPKRLEIMNTLFGKRAVAGGIKLTTANFEKLNEAIDNANGTAQKTATTMDSGIGGTMRRLWSAVEGVAIAIGEALSEELKKLGDMVTGFVSKAAAWIKQNRALVVTVLKVVAVVLAGGVALMAFGGLISALGSILGGLVSVITTVGVAFKVLGVILGAILSPIGLIVTAVAALGAYLIYANGMGGKAVSWLGDKFSKLAEDAKKAFGGIADALAAGDIALAAQILWNTLKLWWLKGTEGLRRIWIDFKAGFVKIFAEAFYGGLKAARKVWEWLEIGWSETTAFFANTWNGFVGFFQKTWERIKAAAQKAWNWIKSLFDDSIDLEAENKLVEQEKQKALARIDNEQNRKIVERDEKRQVERKKIDSEAKAFYARQDEQKRLLQQAADDVAAQEQAALTKQIANLKKQRDDAIAEARRKREAGDADTAPEKLEGPDKMIAEAKKALSGVGATLQQQAEKVTTKGTFNAAALQGLQGSTTDRIAKATEGTEKNTKDIVKNTKKLSEPTWG